MTGVPALKLADPNRKCILTSDVSDFAIRAMLSQILEDIKHSIVFEIREMNQADCNSPTHERELLAFIHVLRTWRDITWRAVSLGSSQIIIH